MPMHWTEFPTRIEKFGDLFHILKTLERDFSADLIMSGSCDKESEESAYKVDFMGHQYEFEPISDRIPGWDDLATLTEREFHSSLDLNSLRMIRGRASEVLDVPTKTVNEMTILQVVEALREADRAQAGADSTNDFLLAEFRWLKVTQIAALFAHNRGHVSRSVDNGVYISNGLTGYERRIDVLSVIKTELERLSGQSSSAEASK